MQRTYRHRLALTGVIAAFAVAGCGNSKDDSGSSAGDAQTRQAGSGPDAGLRCAGEHPERDRHDPRAAGHRRQPRRKLAAGAQAIQADVQQIADAQPDLAPDRRAEVKAAGTTFKNDVARIARQAVASGVTGNAQDALRSAADQLRASYKQAVEPIDCS